MRQTFREILSILQHRECIATVEKSMQSLGELEAEMHYISVEI